MPVSIWKGSDHESHPCHSKFIAVAIAGRQCLCAGRGHLVGCRGERGVPEFVVQNLNRTNNPYEQGQNQATTDKDGNYDLLQAYPLGQFTVQQAFNQRFKTIGVTSPTESNDKGWRACDETNRKGQR